MITEDYGYPYMLYINTHFDIIEGIPSDELHFSDHHARLLIKRSDEALSEIRMPRNDL
jgi:hypothetical protein